VRRILGEDAELLRRAGAPLEALERLEGAAVALVPIGVAGVDAHVHLGRDRDGHALGAEALVADLDRAGLDGAVVFPPDDPGPDGTFGQANAAVLEAARRHPRLVPFCRVDPSRPGAAAAMERAARGGARGLKLHPVAQRFAPESPDAVACVRDAASRGWPVLIHAGFGARPLGDPIRVLCEAAPEARLILAHGGRGDARALRELAADERYRIVFDTSLAAVTDLAALPPERLAFGSDRPYGEHASARQLVGLTARVAGWSPAQLAGVMGGNLRAWLAP
jgi:hypothetical protein